MSPWPGWWTLKTWTLAILLLPASALAQERLPLADRAEPPAREAVDLETLEAEHAALVAAVGEDTVEAAESLIRLGAGQFHEERYFVARDNLRRAVRIYGQHLGLYHPRLVEPLTYLGLNLQAMGHHEAATDAFTRAQHVTHRNDGMLNADQVPMLYSKVDSFRMLGELWELDQLLISGEKLQRHNFGASAPKTVASVNTLGLWLVQRGSVHPALSLFSNARRRMEAEHPAFTEAKLDLLKGNALAFLFVPGLQSKTLDLLGEAKQLAGTHAGEVRPDRHLMAILNHADMLMVFAREREAMDVYAEAWHLIQREPDLGELEKTHFGDLLLVRSPFEAIDPAQLPDSPWFRMGFDLSADGRPLRPKVLESNAKIRFKQAAKAFLRETRFRPSFADGVATERSDQDMYLAFREDFLNQRR